MVKKKMMKTSTGLEFVCDPSVYDDMELLDALCELQENPVVLPKVIRMMMGDEGKKALYEHCRDPKTGKVSFEAIDREIAEIFDLMSGALKK